MVNKEYSAPEMQMIETDVEAMLLTMSTPDTMELDVNDSTENIDGGNAL